MAKKVPKLMGVTKLTELGKKVDVYYFSGYDSERTYKYAEPYSNGLAVVKCEDGLYHYRDMKGNISKDGYEDANSYYNGYGRVEDEEGLYYYRDIDGNVSEDYYAECYDYSGGYAVVLCEDELWHFRDREGNVSRDGYTNVDGYREGYATVKCDDGLYHFRDRDGKVSKDGYAKASGYYKGKACVARYDAGAWVSYFRDKEGNLSAAEIIDEEGRRHCFAPENWLPKKDTETLESKPKGSALIDDAVVISGPDMEKEQQYEDAKESIENSYKLYETGRISEEEFVEAHNAEVKARKTALQEQYEYGDITALELASEAREFSEMLKAERTNHETRIIRRKVEQKMVEDAFNAIDAEIVAPKRDEREGNEK